MAKNERELIALALILVRCMTRVQRDEALAAWRKWRETEGTKNVRG